jgi:excinuclease UvrABC nuclease subunit
MNPQTARQSRSFSRLHNITYAEPEVRLSFAGVYVVLSPEGRALYVGASKRVRQRAFENRKRCQWTRERAFAEAASIEVFPCDSLKQALHLEAELIGLYKPTYNLQSTQLYSLTFWQLQQEHAKLFAEVQP